MASRRKGNRLKKYWLGGISCEDKARPVPADSPIDAVLSLRLKTVDSLHLLVVDLFVYDSRTFLTNRRTAIHEASQPSNTPSTINPNNVKNADPPGHPSAPRPSTNPCRPV